MAHIWTIIFVTVLAVAFSIAAWHDHEEKKRQERRSAAHEKIERAKD
jgi:uncharacterized membrane protein